MGSLVGIYQSPDAARVELDDEARRAISKAVKEGATVVGVFHRDDNELKRVLEEAGVKAWAASEGVIGDE